MDFSDLPSVGDVAKSLITKWIAAWVPSVIALALKSLGGIKSVPWSGLLIVFAFGAAVTLNDNLEWWKLAAPLALCCLAYLHLLVRHIAVTKRSDRLTQVGVVDGVVLPTLEHYKRIIESTQTRFQFLGIGAEKLTRQEAEFRAMVLRCGTKHHPIRLLLLSPASKWLQSGSTRRNLGQSSFSDKHRTSLCRLAEIRQKYHGEIEVRFYDQVPTFRLLLVDDSRCWIGGYTQSVKEAGKNEFEDKSSSNLELVAIDGTTTDRALKDSVQQYFDTLWESATSWDFKTHLK
jgi:hypothetical protein